MYVKKAIQLLQQVASRKDKSVIKQMVEVCRIQLQSPDVAPMSKLCSAKLLKDLFDLAIFPIIDEIQRQILIPFCNIIEYRSEVKSINRGSALFLQGMNKCINFEEECRKRISIANSYFTLVHECLYFWSKFINNSNRSFRQVYEKMSKYCQFPSQFKYFKPGCVEAYHKQIEEEQESIEYEIEELVKLWMGSREKLKQGKELVRVCRAIAQDCQEFSINFQDRMKELEESEYYEKDKLVGQMDRLRREMKQFMELERTRKFDEILKRFSLKNKEQGRQQERSEGTDTKRSNKSVQSRKESSRNEPERDTSRKEQPIQPLKQLIHMPKPPQLSPTPTYYRPEQVEQPEKSSRHLIQPPNLSMSKPQKLKKQPKNMPTFKSIVANVDKGNRSIGQFDTTALDAISNVQVSSRQNTNRTKKDNTVFQKVTTLCQVESLQNIQIRDNNQVAQESQLLKDPTRQAIQQQVDNIEQLSRTKERQDAKQQPPVQHKQPIQETLKLKQLAKQQQSSAPHINLQSQAKKQMSRLSQRNTVCLSLQNSQGSKQEPKRRNFRMSRLKCITIDQSVDKKNTATQAAHKMLDTHHLYSFSIHTRAADRTADTSCQTDKEEKVVLDLADNSTQRMDRTQPIQNRTQMPYPFRKSVESRSSVITNRQKSSSRRRFSSGGYSLNNFPADTLLGHLYQRRACLI